MPHDNDLLLRKAAYTTADLTVGVNRMNRTQADTFIDMTLNEGVMLGTGLSRTVRVDNRKGRVVRMKFANPVTYGVSENTETTDTRKPTFTYFDYDTDKLCTAMDWSSELLEENNEGSSHEDTWMTALATKITEDMERLAILGDTVVYAADSTDLGKLLKVHNGWWKQSASGVLVDFGGSNISKVVFSEMIRAMPNVYLQKRSGLRFFCSPSIVQDYRDQLGSRQTDLGDAAILGSGALTAYGIPIVEVPLIPENLNSYDGSTAHGDATFCWLTFPSNFVHIISRDIETYKEFKPRKDAWELTMYTYTGDFIENFECLVTGVNLRIAGAS